MTQKYQVKVSMKQAAIVETGIVLKQGDFGMQIEIEVLDFDATGTTPQIVFRKAMGAVESTTITVSNNKYTYTFVGTELDTPGKCFCDLKLKNSTTQRISTASFMFRVVADTLDGLNEHANSYSDTIGQIWETLQDYSEDSEAWAKGTRGGSPVPSTDEQYQNNAKYYSDLASSTSPLVLSAKPIDASYTDLNQFTIMGVYALTYGVEYDHDPIGKNHRRLLLTARTATGVLAGQSIYDLDNGNAYFRAYTGGNWFDWDSKTSNDIYGLRNTLKQTQGAMIGVYADIGSGEAERKAINHFESVEVIGEIGNNWKILTVYNGTGNPNFMIISNGTNTINMPYNSTTGLNVGTGSNITVKIKYDWENHEQNVNNTYANSNIYLVGTGLNKEIVENEKNIDDLYDITETIETEAEKAIDGAYRRSIPKAATVLTGYYLAADGLLIGNQGSGLKVSYSAVASGEIVNIYGEDVKLYGNYGLVGFSENILSAGDKVDELIFTGSATATDYEKNYYCKKSGYIYCAFVADAGFGKVNCYNTESASHGIDEIEENAFEYIPAEPVTYTGYQNKYINTDYTIKGIGNEVFYVLQFAVEIGKTYVLKSDIFKLQAALPIAGFGTGDIGETQTLEPIIGSDTATTYTAYNVKYTAPANGYIYIAYVDIAPSEKILLYKAQITIKDLYKLTGASLDTLKIQLFGDSITDEVWRSDKTTWATLLPKFLPQRVLDITNNAVGGSGIGHGKSSTSRYSDLEYNFVYDLVMNNDIFKTDSDIIIMFVGTNDWASDKTLGQWGDDTATTFYGYARLITEYITTNTNALFIICTPIGRWNSSDEQRSTDADGTPINNNNNTLRDFCDALVRTGQFYQVPVLDLNRILGWNKYNVRRFCGDGLHPTPSGAKWLSEIISSEIRYHLGI